MNRFLTPVAWLLLYNSEIQHSTKADIMKCALHGLWRRMPRATQPNRFQVKNQMEIKWFSSEWLGGRAPDA